MSTTVVTKRPVIYSGKCWLLPGEGLGPSWLKAEIY